MLFPTLYSLAEANQLVPFLEDSFAELQAQIAVAQQARADLLDKAAQRVSAGEAAAETLLEADPELAATVKDAEERIHEELLLLHRVGVMVKSLDPPTADVFAHRGASIVNLCWQPGEPEFLHWHSLDAGLQGREPIDDPELFGEPVLPC